MPLDTAHLALQHFPADILRSRAHDVDLSPDALTELRAIAHRMFDIMRNAEGIGLAAPQVGLPWRLFVCDVPRRDPDDDDPPPRLPPPPDAVDATDGPVAYVNPVLSFPRGGTERCEEGCLSLPGIRGDVTRPVSITINAFDLDARPFQQVGTGLLARCWQHEFDHLEGVLIIDKMSQTSKLRTRAALKRLRDKP